jgi:hypothetical protein
MNDDDMQVPRALRLSYEVARLRRALIESSPALLFTLVLLVEGAPPQRLAAGVLIYVTAVLARAVGQSAGDAVLPGLLFGLVPFVIVRVAESAGHVCLGDRCMSWCLPACLVGGLVGGVLVGVRGVRSGDPVAFGLSAATLVVLSGVVGCGCAGGAGMAGVALGTLAGAAVPLAIVRLGRR